MAVFRHASRGFTARNFWPCCGRTCKYMVFLTNEFTKKAEVTILSARE